MKQLLGTQRAKAYAFRASAKLSRNWQGGEEDIRTALDINPNSSYAHLVLGDKDALRNLPMLSIKAYSKSIRRLI